MSETDNIKNHNTQDLGDSTNGFVRDINNKSTAIVNEWSDKLEKMSVLEFACLKNAIEAYEAKQRHLRNVRFYHRYESTLNTIISHNQQEQALEQIVSFYAIDPTKAADVYAIAVNGEY